MEKENIVPIEGVLAMVLWAGGTIIATNKDRVGPRYLVKCPEGFQGYEKDGKPAKFLAFITYEDLEGLHVGTMYYSDMRFAKNDFIREAREDRNSQYKVAMIQKGHKL